MQSETSQTRIITPCPLSAHVLPVTDGAPSRPPSADPTRHRAPVERPVDAPGYHSPDGASTSKPTTFFPPPPSRSSLCLSPARAILAFSLLAVQRSAAGSGAPICAYFGTARAAQARSRPVGFESSQTSLTLPRSAACGRARGGETPGYQHKRYLHRAGPATTPPPRRRGATGSRLPGGNRGERLGGAAR
jgi:hypothetical protein